MPTPGFWASTDGRGLPEIEKLAPSSPCPQAFARARYGMRDLGRRPGPTVHAATASTTSAARSPTPVRTASHERADARRLRRRRWSTAARRLRTSRSAARLASPPWRPALATNAKVSSRRTDSNRLLSISASSASARRRPGRRRAPHLLGLFALINIFIGVFNLVPLLPFDGGHVGHRGLRADPGEAQAPRAATWPTSPGCCPSPTRWSLRAGPDLRVQPVPRHRQPLGRELMDVSATDRYPRRRDPPDHPGAPHAAPSRWAATRPVACSR